MGHAAVTHRCHTCRTRVNCGLCCPGVGRHFVLPHHVGVVLGSSVPPLCFCYGLCQKHTDGSRCNGTPVSERRSEQPVGDEVVGYGLSAGNVQSLGVSSGCHGHHVLPTEPISFLQFVSVNL